MTQPIFRLKVGQKVMTDREITPTMFAHWKYFTECDRIGGGMVAGAVLSITEINPHGQWVRVQIPGRDPPGFFKIAGDNLAHNFTAIL